MDRQNWYTVVCILIECIISYGIIFHEYHCVRMSVLTGPSTDQAMPGFPTQQNFFFLFFYLFIFFCFTTTTYFFFLFFSFPFNFSSFIFFIIFKSEQPQKSGSLFNLHRHLTGKILRKGSSTSLDRAEILRDRSILSHSLVHSPTRIRLFPSGIFKLNDKFFHFLSR